MQVSQAFPSQYLKAADLQGKSVRVVVDRVELEEVGDGHKPVIYFQGKEKGLVCNRTNANNIAMIYGDEMDNWIGQPVELFMAMVDFQGRTVEAIRVRVPRPVVARPSGAAPSHRAPVAGKTAEAHDELNPPVQTDVPF